MLQFEPAGENVIMGEADRLFTDGKAYERLIGRWSRLVGEDFLDWLDVPQGLRWLDVGCGNGAFTEEVVARNAPAAVFGIDPSEDQIAYARARPGTTMVQYQIGDAQGLPFADSSFDIAIMALVISFVPDPAKAVGEMVRVVRPGGWVATYMWDLPGGGSPVTAMYTAFESLGWSGPVRPNPPVSRLDALQDLWEKAALETIETRVIRIPVTYDSFDDYWNTNSAPIGPQGKLIAQMSAEKREQYRARLREHVPVAADGRVDYESFANAVKGCVPRTSRPQ